jgi:hypothetical protein
MKSKVDLRAKFRRGAFLTTFASFLALTAALGTVFLWGLLGPTGLTIAIVLFDVALFLVVFGSRNLVNSVVTALQGGHDSSDFTEEIRKATDPTAELQQLRNSLARIQNELTSLKAEIAKKGTR